MRKKIDILGIDVINATSSEVLEELDLILKNASGRVYSLCFVNAHTANIAFEDKEAKKAIVSSDFILNDGVGLDLAAKYRGQSFLENLNGTDFTPKVLGLCEQNGYKVFLLGTRQKIIQQTSLNLQKRFPSLKIVGYRNGFFSNEEVPTIIEEINQSDADLLIVALGNPKQELWISNHKSQLRVKLAMGVGAYFDFAAGAVKRAPMWMRKLKFEWFYRLCIESKRMWQRYLIGNFKFMFRMMRYRR